MRGANTWFSVLDAQLNDTCEGMFAQVSLHSLNERVAARSREAIMLSICMYVFPLKKVKYFNSFIFAARDRIQTNIQRIFSK